MSLYNAGVAPTFSANEMRVPLTGVANRNVIIHLAAVNGSGTADVTFGFLIADANASRLLDKTDKNLAQAQIGQPVTAANFREDMVPDGRIKQNSDLNDVKTHKNTVASVTWSSKRSCFRELSYPTLGKLGR